MSNPMYPQAPQTQRRWDFGGSALPELWSTVSLGTGMGVSVASSMLAITTGTAANSETIVRCTQPLRIKVVAKIIAYITQRIANQTFQIELMNAAGTSGVVCKFDSSAQNKALFNTKNNSISNSDVGVTCPANTTSATAFTIGVETDIAYLEVAAVNSPDLRSSVAAVDRYLPDSDELLYLQFRITNGATAPASTTTFYVDAVSLNDVQHTPVAFSNLAGSYQSALAIPVRSVAAFSVNNNAVAYTETVTPLGANSVFTSAGHDSLAPIYNKAMIFINSDQACTYEFQQSTDNVTFFTTNTEALTANSFFNVEENLVARYWRVKVTNGATAQTSFKVYSRMRS